MRKYWLIRLVLVIPVIFLVALTTFFMSRMVPGDPVQSHMSLGSERRGGSQIDPVLYEQLYLKTAERYHLDLPWFYFSLKPSILKRVPPTDLNFMAQKRLNQMIVQFGNETEVTNFILLHKALFDRLKGETDTDPSIRRGLIQIDTTLQADVIGRSMQVLSESAFGDSPEFNAMQSDWAHIMANPPRWQDFTPALFWHGGTNQFHKWIFNFFKGNLGNSFQDGRAVSDKVLAALWWSLPINILAWILIIGLSLVIAVWAVRFKSSKWPGQLEFLLLVINAIPLFWIASLAVIYLTGSKAWQFFPSPGSMNHLIANSFADRLWSSFIFILLPLGCIVINSLAVLSRQIRQLLDLELSKPYVKSAILRGIPTKVVIWKYALPNALIPLTAYVGRIIPALVSGSVIIESIFNIPGIGNLMVSATIARDWNVSFALFFMGTILTILGVLLSDYLLSRLSPISSKSLIRSK